MGLREFRRERGLTIEALAYLAERDIGTISRVERGLVDPEKETVVRLAKALGISVYRLLEMIRETRLAAVSREVD